jgi:hypothetical protein
MNTNEISGQWVLIGSTSRKGEVRFINEEPIDADIFDWLNGQELDVVDEIEQTNCLSMSIFDDNTFTEVKNNAESNFDWYDEEGVLDPDFIPFGGAIKCNAHGIFIQPKKISAMGLPTEEYGAILRYDDGDTKICDRISLHEKNMIRTISIVTDELYLDRTILVYKKLQ